jgi:hypothetical protein
LDNPQQKQIGRSAPQHGADTSAPPDTRCKDTASPAPAFEHV